MASADSRLSNVQYAALPWRSAKGAIEVLLVTSLTTRRWIVPKGWPLAGKTPSECAAMEALEEAGLLGTMTDKSLGSFRFNKRRKSGEIVPCKVELFAMRVVRQRHSFAEKGARKTRWCSIGEALARVSDPGLRRLITKFAKTSGMRNEDRAKL